MPRVAQPPSAVHGRKAVATLGSVAWTLALLVGLMLPAVSIGAPAATWSVPLALAIAAPTLIAIGGFNRKSIAVSEAHCAALWLEVCWPWVSWRRWR